METEEYTKYRRKVMDDVAYILKDFEQGELEIMIPSIMAQAYLKRNKRDK